MTESSTRIFYPDIVKSATVSLNAGEYNVKIY